jgi:hypothetical protein
MLSRCTGSTAHLVYKTHTLKYSIGYARTSPYCNDHVPILDSRRMNSAAVSPDRTSRRGSAVQPLSGLVRKFYNTVPRQQKKVLFAKVLCACASQSMAGASFPLPPTHIRLSSSFHTQNHTSDMGPRSFTWKLHLIRDMIESHSPIV